MGGFQKMRMKTELAKLQDRPASLDGKALNPRRGIMMRLMRSLVSTQALPVVEFELSTMGLAQIRTDGATGVEKCLSVINPLEMKFNPVAAGLFTSQPLSVYIYKFTQKERRFISKSF